ncbi:hypothetical protein GCM10025868_28370 [Angustibacter aerolatus]|uniref:RNA polymerase sigma-70 region 2 domain-containing protein n=1 Tax=Angustibacter aerolatus TaxID=1162965 RepID=A0ABQ6JL61_9ACTN|nr:sigma-70 family RNA polymerase sigma factor [Angustibacter aerolatus]GMA87587.1 hypothetical protein GCM10025868_28370 [Angustibacter aerolatus]
MTDVLHTDEVAEQPVARPTEHDLQPFRREPTGYCYRMLGSAFDADDAVQETMVRAWKALDRFEGRSSLRSWLYRIATNVCLDHLDARGRRALPMDMSPDPSAPVVESLGTPSPEGTWVEPAPTTMLQPAGDPADLAVAREGVKARLRRRAADPAPEAARRAGAARGAALARRRGRRACSRPPSRRSTARCSGPGRRSPTATSATRPCASTR